MRNLTIKLAGLALLVSTSACDNLWDQEEVPEAVKVHLSELYPNVKNVDWDQEDEGYEAEFDLSGRERSVLFDVNGKLIRVAEEITNDHLPVQAMTHVQQHFQNHKVEEVHRVTENSTIMYEVELEQNSDEVLLIFSENGELLQQQGAQQPVKAQHASLAGPLGIAAGESDFARPLARWELPAELREISGIALLPGNKMACVQDEEGAIFIYDLQNKKVENKIKFGGPGDYEEIAVAGATAYVLRSDGAVFEIADFMAKPRVTEHESVLASTQDTEGLAYDEKGKRLLIACKGYDEKLGPHKGIYALDLSKKKMELEPAIKIPLAQAQLQGSDLKRKDAYDVLQPSSLEVHPQTGDLYLLDAENQRLMILSEDGKIERAVSLDKDLLRQPEGLAFGDNGEVYIASEGSKKGRGVILMYEKGL